MDTLKQAQNYRFPKQYNMHPVLCMTR